MSLVDLGKRLLEAAKLGNTDEVKGLMSSGAPFTTDWLGTSPLHFAAQSGHYDTADVLLRAGISRDARTKVDRTPLHVAAQAGHLGIVQLLLKHNADIDAKDMLKMTPLHWAVEKEHLEVVEFLIRHNADITCENKFDKSAVDLAVSKSRDDIANLMQLSQNNIHEVCVDSTEHALTEEVTATSALEENISNEIIMNAANVKKEKNLDGDDVDQSSTSVLATLAALAEATAPLNSASVNASTASDALNWLETHGITMISGNDSSNFVTSQIDSGQTLTLTEAGKLALKFVKQAKNKDGRSKKSVNVKREEKRTYGSDSDESEDNRKLFEGRTKKRKSSDSTDAEKLRQQLEQIQKEAETFKIRLQKKEEEAEGYKKKLAEKQ